MVLLIALVFGIALLGVNSIRALDHSVDQELSLLLESTDLGNGLVSSVASEIRSAEQYLVRPDGPAARLHDAGGGRLGLRVPAPLPRRWDRSPPPTATSSTRSRPTRRRSKWPTAMAHALTDLGRS